MITGYSKILDQLGLGTIDIGLIIIILSVITLILLILTVVLSVRLTRINKRLKIFMSGKDGADLEQDIMQLFEDNKQLKNATAKNRKDIKSIFSTLEHTYQKMGLVKYDAFDQMGGKLSFSLALLDENNNGFILNAVHGAEGCYIYTKDITAGICDIALGAEETEALSQAVQSV